MEQDIFFATPAGSLVDVAEDQQTAYIQELRKLPLSLLNVATSTKVGSYVRGLMKSFDLPSQQETSLAFSIFEVLVGRRQLSELAALFSTRLGTANDKAQAIAREIERDLFAPIALELNQYLASQKKQSGSMVEKLGIEQQKPRSAPLPSPNIPSKFPRKPAAPPNILNLKDQRPGPKPPPIPR